MKPLFKRVSDALLTASLVVAIGGGLVLLAPHLHAKPVTGLVWSGYGALPWPGDKGPQANGTLCYGEDSQNYTQLSGTLGAGEFAPVALPVICDDPSWAGGVGLAMHASTQGNAQVLVRIVSPSGKVYTHDSGDVCVNFISWDYTRGTPDPIGTGWPLEGGTWRMEAWNPGRQTARNVIVNYQLHMAYTGLEPCPPGDITRVR